MCMFHASADCLRRPSLRGRHAPGPQTHRFGESDRGAGGKGGGEEVWKVEMEVLELEQVAAQVGGFELRIGKPGCSPHLKTLPKN